MAACWLVGWPCVGLFDGRMFRPLARLLSGEVLISHYRDHALLRDYTNAAKGSGGTL